VLLSPKSTTKEYLYYQSSILYYQPSILYYQPSIL